MPTPTGKARFAPLYLQQPSSFDPVPRTCFLVKSAQFHNPVMTVGQLKLAEWPHFRVINKPTSLCAER